MKLSKSICENFFAEQFSNALPGINKKAPFARFGPVVLKYEPIETSYFTEVGYAVYLFDGKDKSLKSGICPFGRLTPIFEKHFNYIPFPQEIWDIYGDQITEQFNNWIIYNK